MNFKDMIIIGKNRLSENNIDTGQVHLLVRDLLKINEIDEMNNIEIPKSKEKIFYKAITRLINNEPIQYIIGNTNFYGRAFKVTKSVLIPRFETEELVEQTINYIKKKFNKEISIVDIGTGSGVIGITLKKELPNSYVVLSDISKRALKIAKYNAMTLEANVDIIHSDMFKKILISNKKYDVIISNPPYLKKDDLIMDIVINNEPSKALFGGKDGLFYYREILRSADEVLKSKGLIALEIGDTQTEEIIKLINTYLKDVKYEVKKDLQERDRMLFIFKNLDD